MIAPACYYEIAVSDATPRVELIRLDRGAAVRYSYRITTTPSGSVVLDDEPAVNLGGPPMSDELLRKAQRAATFFERLPADVGGDVPDYGF